MQRPLTNYGNPWGAAPFAMNPMYQQPYVGPFGAALPPDPTQETALTSAILQLVAAGLIGGALVGASAPGGQGYTRGVYGAGLAAGAVGVVQGFILGFKEQQPGLGVGIGLLGALTTWLSYISAKKG